MDPSVHQGRGGTGGHSFHFYCQFKPPFKQVRLVAKDVAAVVGLVTRQMSPEVEEALEEEKEDYGVERDWTLSFLDSLVLDNLASGKIPYKPRNT